MAGRRRLVSLTWLAACVILVLACGLLSPLAARSAPRIAFPLWEQASNTSHIWSVSTAGETSLLQLTSGQLMDYACAWSSDRRTIAFVRNASGDQYDRDSCVLMAMNADGSGQHEVAYAGPRLTTGTMALAYSPDGRYLAGGRFVAEPNRRSVVLLDLRTGRSRTLQNFQSEGDIWSLTWSPNSRQLALTVEYGGGSGGWRVDVSTGRTLNRYRAMTATVSWRADGRRLLCTWYAYPGRPLRTQLRRPNGALVKTIGKAQGSAVYSPSGRQYAFLAGGGVGAAVRYARADGTNVRTLFRATARQYIYPPAWR